MYTTQYITHRILSTNNVHNTEYSLSCLSTKNIFNTIFLITVCPLKFIQHNIHYRSLSTNKSVSVCVPQVSWVTSPWLW